MTQFAVNPRLLEVPLYIAGKSAEEVQKELGLADVLKLGSNESPSGPSTLAVEAAKRALANAHRYPGAAERELCCKLASRLGTGWDERNIVVGNGATDVLRMITQAFVFDGGNTVMCRVTFPMYRILTATFGGTPKCVDPTPDYRHDLRAMAAAIDEDTRVLYLCSPNNPTGNIVTQAAADEFMALVPERVVVVFDESYRDYVTDPDCADSLAFVKAGRNVVVARSFSKSAGLANLRVGYLIGRTEIADYVRHAQLPFNTGAVALEAAAASLDDVAYHARNQQTVLEGRAYLYATLYELGLNALPSQANFVLIVDPPVAAQALADALLQEGIIVRAMAAFGMPNAVRVSVGTPAQNRRFIGTLRKMLSVSRVAQ